MPSNRRLTNGHQAKSKKPARRTAKDLFREVHPTDALVLATKYGAPIAGVVLAGPLTSVLPLGIWAPLITSITTALARYQLRQATVSGFRSLLYASGLGGIWTQILAFFGFVSLGTVLGPISPNLQAYLATLAMSTGNFQPVLLCIGLCSLSSAKPSPWAASVSALRLILIQSLFRKIQLWAVAKGLQKAGVMIWLSQVIETARAVQQLNPLARGKKKDEISNEWAPITKDKHWVTEAYGGWEVVEPEDEDDTDEFVVIEKGEVIGYIRH